MTNVRPGRRVGDPCPSCCGSGALLPGGGGQAISALHLVPDRRQWRNLPIAPCPACDGYGIELLRRPRCWAQG